MKVNYAMVNTAMFNITKIIATAINSNKFTEFGTKK